MTPKIAYVGDVPPDQVAAGALLLHRLFAGLDPDRIAVILGNLLPSDPAVRLPAVAYEQLRYAPVRLLQTRFAPWAAAVLSCTTPAWGEAIVNRLRVWGAEAVVTVPHFYLWRAAAAAADKLGLPLILICHDDWPTSTPGPSGSEVYYRREFRRHYRRAAARLCVSPGMAEHYERTCGVPGEVFYPTRGDDSPTANVRVRPNGKGPPVLAYVGSLHNPGYLDLVKRAGAALAAVGGRIDLYTQTPSAAVVAAGLTPPAVNLVGFLPPREIAERVAATAHALFCPVSFLAVEAQAMKTLFPSKLVDYTAMGLPVLIWGPEDSSAVRWVRENPGAAVVVTDPAGVGMAELVVELAANPARAREVATAGMAAGNRDFDVSIARGRFHALLTTARRPVA